jgi:chromosome partitioning protein
LQALQCKSKFAFFRPGFYHSAHMRKLAIANHKGGVGKTATTQALGAVLAGECARRVLLVDADPQASLTAACGVASAEGGSLAEVLGAVQPGALTLTQILRELGPGLFLAPADIALAVTELGLVTRLGRETIMRRALATVADRFDIALIDCPPGLGSLTINALAAADAVLIPTQPQGADLRALRLFLDTVERIRDLNPALEILGILPTFYDKRLTHHCNAIAAMQRAGLPVLPVAIGRSVRVAEAAAAGQAITAYAPDNPQSTAYRQLAKVVNAWLENART